VRQLPPGHVLRWERGSRKVRVEPYWTPAEFGALGSREAFDDLVAETGQLLEQSVRSRLIADVPIGLLPQRRPQLHADRRASGKAVCQADRTFTVDCASDAGGEAAQARRIARELGTEHHELVLTHEQLLERVPALLAGMDQPLADRLSSRSTLSRSTRAAT
jgi:asparagine synthase (glutamine-hydrolysing)